LVGITVVALGVAVLVVAILALREPKGHVASDTGTQHTRTVVSTVTNTPSRTPPSTAARSSSRSSSAPSSPARSGVKAVPLVVLNNTAIPGLARSATQTLRSDGWTVTRYDNYRNDIISTCAYYDPSVPGAEAAANALRDEYSWIKRTKARFAELPSAPVVVVLTRDFTAG
jgi:hypothetical protein